MVDFKKTGKNAGGQQKSKRRENVVEKTDGEQLKDKVVHINRCAKVVKGGRRFGFAALVVVGNCNGRVGVGYGKAKEVPDAIKKASDRAKRNMMSFQLNETTVPHDAIGISDGGKVLLRPAAPGTGVIAGGGARAVLELLGIKDVLTKSLGSNNPLSVVQATLLALGKMRTVGTVRALRAATGD